MKNLLAALALMLTTTPAFAEKPALEFRLGLDYLAYEQSDISGLNGMSVFYATEQGYYGGVSIYSAAIGAGGGFFVGGWEMGKHTLITDKLFWDAGVFVGGGGGPIRFLATGLCFARKSISGMTLASTALGLVPRIFQFRAPIFQHRPLL